MDQSTQDATRRDEQRIRQRAMVPLTWVRQHRLEKAVRLVDVAVATGISMNRLSLIERRPQIADADVLEQIIAAVDEIAAARAGAQ